MPILAQDVVRFIGEKVAAVAADCRRHREDRRRGRGSYRG
jgi:hypothetical protein